MHDDDDDGSQPIGLGGENGDKEEAAGGEGSTGGNDSTPQGGKPSEGGNDGTNGTGHRKSTGGSGGTDPLVGTGASFPETETGGSSGNASAASGGGSGGSGSTVSCGNTYYDINPERGLYDCVPLTVCGSGEKVLSNQGPQTDRTCEPCPDGTFSTQPNQQSCEEWRTCVLGLSSTWPGSSATDVACGLGNGPFAASLLQDDELFVAASLQFAASAEAIYSTLGRSTIQRTSFDGIESTTWSLQTTPGEPILGLSGLGNNIYIINAFDGSTTTKQISGGYLTKLDPSGTEIWKVELSEVDTYLGDTRLTNDGTNLYVVRVTHPCEGNGCVDLEASKIILTSYTAEGVLLWETIHDAPQSGTSLAGFAVADELVHVGIKGFSGDVLKRFDTSGLYVDDTFSVESDEVSIFAMQADPQGGVMLFTYPDRIFRVEADNEPQEIKLAISGDYARAMLVTENDILLAGGPVGSDDDLFLMKVARNGTSSVLAPAWGNAEVDIAQAVLRSPSGEIFLTGVTESEGLYYNFVQPWPE